MAKSKAEYDAIFHETYTRLNTHGLTVEEAEQLVCDLLINVGLCRTKSEIADLPEYFEKLIIPALRKTSETIRELSAKKMLDKDAAHVLH